MLDFKKNYFIKLFKKISHRWGKEAMWSRSNFLESIILNKRERRKAYGVGVYEPAGQRFHRKDCEIQSPVFSPVKFFVNRKIQRSVFLRV